MRIWKCLLIALLALPSFTWAEWVGEVEPKDDDNDSAAIVEEGGEEGSEEEDEPAEGSEEGSEEAEEAEEGEEGSEEDGDDFTLEQFEQLHAKIDADNNGKLSLDEILQFSHTSHKVGAAKQSKDMMKEMDQDKDGKVNATEYSKDLLAAQTKMDRDKFNIQKIEEQHKFEETDANHDGFIDQLEFEASLQHKNVAASTLSNKDTDYDELLTIKEFYGSGGTEDQERTFDDDDMQTFKDLDTDGSGKLDLQELIVWESGQMSTEEAMRDLMNIADTDSDQHITVEEVVAAQGKDEGNANFYFMDWIKHHEL